MAVQIGDYDRAVNELKALAENPDLTAEQKQAVRDLLAQTLKRGTGDGSSAGSGATDGTKPETPR